MRNYINRRKMKLSHYRKIVKFVDTRFWKKMFHRQCVLFYSMWIFFYSTLKLLAEEIEIHEEIIEIDIFPVESKYRQRRSTNDEFPSSINLLVKSKDPVYLELHRVARSYHVLEPAILCATNHGLFSEESRGVNRQSAFYKDGDQMTAFTLTSHNGNGYTVRGSFVKDGTLHNIEPTMPGNKKVEHTRTHRLTKHKQPLDFTGDEIIFNDLSTENRFRRQVEGNINDTTSETAHRDHQTEDNINETASESKSRELYLEYVIVVDYSSYSRWKERVSCNLTDEEKDRTTKSEIVDFYRHVVHGIDVIFNTAGDQGSEFHIVLTGIVICNESQSCLWMERHRICDTCSEIDDQRSLMGFYQWRESVLLTKLKHDHAALFTGYDLYHTDMASKSTVGVSYVGTVCENWSVSIMEERRNALSIHTAAHELGHSFGSHHDGSTNAEACSSTDKFIMQSKLSRILDKSKANHPWTFSPCSINSIMDYLEKLDGNNKNCLLNTPKVQPEPQTKPGLLYSADTQCQAMYGVNSSVCRDYHYEDWSSLCYGIACNDHETGLCKSVLPYDGTPCGYKNVS